MRETILHRSATEMTCNKCGNVLCASEWSFDFTEEGAVINFCSCVKCRNPATLLITMDHWMSLLFPTENRTIEDFARLSARLRAAMGPHIVDILRQDLSVVLDFPANTVILRSWMRS